MSADELIAIVTLLTPGAKKEGTTYIARRRKNKAKEQKLNRALQASKRAS